MKHTLLCQQLRLMGSKEMTQDGNRVKESFSKVLRGKISDGKRNDKEQLPGVL